MRNFRLPSLVLACLVLVSLGLVVERPSRSEKGGPFDDPVLVAEKQAHLDDVVATLRDRSRDDLDEQHRVRRAAALDELASYSNAGVFIHDTHFTGDATPYFRDPHDRLCALGHLIHASGEQDLLEDLVARDNNAWISQIHDHQGLDSWLDHHGLTKAEVAYIQGPGFVTDQPNPNRGPVRDRPGPLTGGETGGRERVVRSSGRPSGRTTGSTPQAWTGWWATSWRRFGGVRAAGEARAVGANYESLDQRRPARDRIAADVAPVLEQMARGKDDVASTAVVALARAIGRDDPARALKTAVRAQRTLGSAGRPFAVLALAWIPSEASRERLVHLVTGSAEGRKALGLSRSIPDRVRAYAAFGLGVHGGDPEVQVLLKQLVGGHKSSPDLRAALVTGLGIAAERGVQRAEIEKTLTRLLGNGRLADEARAAIPGVLARMNSAPGRLALTRLVHTFDGPVIVRRAAAQALGRYASADELAAEALGKAARRDPDPIARQRAILALGELALSGALETKQQARVGRFLLDGLTQRFKQAVDRPAFSLAAALLARGDEDHAPAVLMELRSIIDGSASVDDQAAAALALGLLDVSPALSAVQGVESRAKSVPVLARAIEARGLHGDPDGLASWVDRLKNDASDDVRRSAARALARLQDPAVLPELLSELEATKSNAARGVISEVLGEIGDRDLVSGLLALAGKKRLSQPVRMRTVAALGRLSEPEDRTWFHGAADFTESTALTPSLQLLTSIF